PSPGLWPFSWTAVPDPHPRFSRAGSRTWGAPAFSGPPLREPLCLRSSTACPTATGFNMPSPTIFPPAANGSKATASGRIRRSCPTARPSWREATPFSTRRWHGCRRGKSNDTQPSFSGSGRSSMIQLGYRGKIAVVLVGMSFSLNHVAYGQNLPKGEELLDKYVVATGGKEAYEKCKNRLIKGTMEF